MTSRAQKSHVSMSLMKLMRKATEKFEGNVSLICPSVLGSQKPHVLFLLKDYWQLVAARDGVFSSGAKPLIDG